MKNMYLLKSFIVLMLFTTAISFGQISNITQNMQYTTINDAIAAAQAGDVIQVGAGTYTGDININKSITLKGPNAIVPGAASRNAEAVISNSKVTFTGAITAVFTGFKIYQTNNITETVTISSSSNVTFKNNVLERYGVSTGTVARAVFTNPNATGAIIIEGNKFTGDDSGNLFSGHKTWQSAIWTSGNTNLVISNNYFEHCRSALNINPMSAGITIAGNTFTDNGQHITFGGAPSAGTYTLGANEFGTTRDGIINLSGLAATFKVDITSSKFNGMLASELSLSQQMAIESAMYHKGRSGRNGLVYFVPNQLFVVSGVSGTIQQAIDHASAGNIINIGEGTYTDAINVNKTLTVKGANPATTIINPPSTGGGASVSLNANNIFLSGITVTRNCPDLNSWFAATKNNGILVGQNKSGVVIDNVIVKRNRNGIYWAKSQVTVTNSLIEENRTGFNIDGNLTGTVITNNIIRNNLTHGIAFNNNTNNIINLTGVVVSNNSITGNYHTNIAFLDDNGFAESGTALATCNWFGTEAPVTNAATTTEPAYTEQVPGFFGGAIPAAPINGDLGGLGIANIISTPRLTVGNNMALSGVGFSGDLASCDAITTKIKAEQCGTVIAGFSSGIFANPVNGATAYRFRVNNGFTVELLETASPYFALNQLTNYGYAASLSIDVSCFVNGAWTIYGSACNLQSPAFPLTQVQLNQCGTTVNFNTGIFANQVSVVTKYRFKVTNGGNEQLFETPNRWFRLRDLATYSYQTTYTIQVATFSNGLWSEYGPACTVSTPATPPLTQLSAGSCGTTLASLGSGIFCNSVPLAQMYRFRTVSSTGLTQEFETTNANFKLNQLPVYAYGLSYTIDVAIMVDGEWGAYGTACVVNAPAMPPAVSLTPEFCGVTVASRQTSIFTSRIPAVSMYRFRIVSPSGTQIIETPQNFFRISMLSGVLAGQTLTVDVMTISTTGISSAYGNTCNVTLSASAARMASDSTSAKVSAKTYPNPFVTGFTVQMETESLQPVTVTVFDMNGRQLDSFTAEPSQLGEKQFGAGYAAGIYNIMITQGTEQKVMHVVKN